MAYLYANQPLPYFLSTQGGASNAISIFAHYDPIDVFKLCINLKDGTVINYAYWDGIWTQMYKGYLYYPLKPFYNLPVYIAIPQGVYLLAIG